MSDIGISSCATDPAGAILEISPARPDELGTIQALLKDCGLPCQDLSHDHLAHFLVLRRGAELVGSVAIEPYGRHALLRSLVLNVQLRGLGWGQRLVAAIEAQARDLGVQTMYLLTTSATAFFQAQAYRITARAEAPAPLQATTQFSMLCPASSTCMTKSIAAASHPASTGGDGRSSGTDAA